MIEGLKLRAENSPTVQRIMIAAEASPKVPLSFAAIALCVALLAAPVWGWHVGRTRDAWWREHIAAASKPVKDIMNRGNTDLPLEDEQIIKALGDSDAELTKAKNDLNAEHNPASGCPALPRRCYGMR